MSRPPFKIVPVSFIDACASGEINERQFFLGCFVLRYACYKTGRLSLTLGELIQRSDYKLSPDSLLNDLKALRPAWIEYESKQGQRTPYNFRTTGLATEDDAASLPNDFRNELPDSSEVEAPHSEVASEVPSEVNPASQEVLDDSDQVPHSEVPAGVSPSTTSTTSSEGDNALGKTTVDDEPPYESEPEFPPLLDALEPDPFFENARLLSAEEISELGSVPLGELRRRHESGEL